MQITDHFKRELAELCPDWHRHTFLLAISGGVDSMVLLHLFLNAGISVRVAHVNYNLRGTDSMGDQQLVEKNCRENAVPLHLLEAPEKSSSGSIQVWAREIRYNFFSEIKKSEKLKYLVTAHHLNDEIETFLINLSKASGIRGLSGIPAKENDILRPLLACTKEEIYRFARENEIEFREDASNKKNEYLRNKIRNKIVPELEKIAPDFLMSFRRSLIYLKETEEFTREQISGILEKISKTKGDAVYLDKQEFLKLSSFVQFEILTRYGFSSRTELDKIPGAERGKRFHSGSHQLTVEYDALIISDKLGVEEIEATHVLQIENNQIKIPPELVTANTSAMPVWTFDKDSLALPLILRKPNPDDRFFPIGMKGSKKISKFFKDEKIPNFARQSSWILCDSSDKILGIFPYRQDRRTAATAVSRRVLTLNFVAAENEVCKNIII